MNRLFDFQHPKRSHRRALGLLLALPLGGLAFQPTAAHAQPAPALAAKKSLKPLSTEQKAAIEKVMVIARQENVCQRRIDLKVENANMEDVADRVKQSLQDKTVSIEVRGASPVHVGFDLKDTPAGSVLTNVAALAGCKLYLLSGGLLISPSSQLTDAEKAEVAEKQSGEWGQSLAAGGMGWTNQIAAKKIFAKAIAQELTGSDSKPFPATVAKSAFGDFSPDAQAILQQLAQWASDSVRSRFPSAEALHLTAGSPVVVDTSNPESVHISISPGNSDPNAVSTGMNIYMH